MVFFSLLTTPVCLLPFWFFKSTKRTGVCATAIPIRRRRLVKKEPFGEASGELSGETENKQKVTAIVTSPDNPVLNSKYGVSNDRAKVLKEKAVDASAAILSLPVQQLTASSENIGKARLLPTYSAKTFKKQAGVYVVRNVTTNYVVVGQASNLQARLETYPHRAQCLQKGKKIWNTTPTEVMSTQLINATLELRDINPRAAFEKVLVLWFPKESQSNSNLTEGVSQATQNEINYFECLLIHIFQTVGGCYNTEFVSEETKTCMSRPKKSYVRTENVLKPSRQLTRGARACKIEGEFYMSVTDYLKYFRKVHNKKKW